jgi:hypothetical protein
MKMTGGSKAGCFRSFSRESQAISEVMRRKGAAVVEVGEAPDPCRIEAHAIDGRATGVPSGKVEVAEHVIEGAVLHHHDNNALDG